MAQSIGTPGLDRRATLDEARKLAESGQTLKAIESYELLALDDPSDWALRNTLGDLLVRARQTDKAVQQFLKAAQLQADAGFMAHASGLLKKALRVVPNHSEAKKRLDALNGTRFKRPEQPITPRRTVPAPPLPRPAPAASAPVERPVVASVRAERPAAAEPVPVPKAVERAPVAAAVTAPVERATPVAAVKETPAPIAAKAAPVAPQSAPARAIVVPVLPVPAKLVETIPVPEPPVSPMPALPKPVAPMVPQTAEPVPVASTVFVSSMTVLDVRPALIAVSKFASA